MLPLFAENLNLRAEFLLNCVDDTTREQCIKENNAAPVTARESPFQALIAVDSFIFESRSTYEIVGKFIHEFFRHLFDQKITEDEIKQELAARGVASDWIEDLRQWRTSFFHETPPWVGFARDKGVHEEGLAPWQLVIIPDENNKMDSEHVLPIDACHRIYQGLTSSLRVVEHWLISKIDEFESQQSPYN